VHSLVRDPVEVWAGIECSLNRVGDHYTDQLARGGQYRRPDDIDRLAALGVRAIRFPVLWERVVALGAAAWDWTDACLERLRAHGITPIIGLLHHGSGPAHTSLIDPTLPAQFAQFARTVAERYPWVKRFTPINEPLTTARFSTLYGLWYPHARSAHAFARACITQCQAIAAAMRAIREITPEAQLVQTEDLGKTHTRRRLRYQAAFENERRWLTFDLLTGRVRGRHPLVSFLRFAGISTRELEALAENACPPDILGVNHYLTSERFLDERCAVYPSNTHGGNGRDRYADVEAVRVLSEGPDGPYALLREAWQRYRLPLAVTEAHLACTREQQLRWLDEIWRSARQLREEGVDIRAVTAWSAFGAHDWNSLLTRDAGVYESGLFDTRAPSPRPTALARMVQSLASGGSYDHPALQAPGWWRCDERLTYPAVSVTKPESRRRFALRRLHPTPRPLLIVGATGTLGRAVARACELRGIAYRALTRRNLDIADASAVTAVIGAISPWAIVNCAGFVRVDDAEQERHACQRENVDGARVLARACANTGTRFVTVSTDLVFDGHKRAPYVETDHVRPLCEYGRSKAEAEALVLAADPAALIIRTAAFFGEHDQYNFVTRALQSLASGQPYTAISDVVVSPTYVPDLVDAMLDLLIDGEAGVWHVATGGAVTWEELARRAAHTVGVSTATLRAVPLEELGLQANRPRYTALGSARGTLLGPLDDALRRYARTRAWERTHDVPTGSAANAPVEQRRRASVLSTSNRPSVCDDARAGSG
jgi:dTDP-4-dehydrorhamnose reductase